jgi:predicted dehydrogenase
MKMRAAVAGAGLMGFWHARSIARVGGKVVAVCDINPEAARRLASHCKGARASARLEEILERDKINVLHVCTPLGSHFELTSAALTRGIHVLVEKPITAAWTETERLYELAAENRVLLCPVHQFPFQGGVQKALKEFGRIGQLRHFEATFCSAGGAGRGPAELDAIVAEILPHPLSLMQIFTPESFREEGWVVTRPAPGELRAVVNARDICFSILISMNSRPTVSALRLLGTRGTAHIDLFHGFCLIESGAVSKLRKIAHPFDLAVRTLVAAGSNLTVRAWERESAYPGLQQLIRGFYGAITNGQPAPLRREEVMREEKLRALIIENQGRFVTK